MSQYDKVVIDTFIKNQLQLFPGKSGRNCRGGGGVSGDL